MQAKQGVLSGHQQSVQHPAASALRPCLNTRRSSCCRPHQLHARQPCRVVLTSHADPLVASIVSAADQHPGVSPPEPSPPFSKQQLLDVAATFVRLWFAGIAKGPQAVEHELADILAPDVLIKADKVKHFKDTEGLHEVLAELERAHLEYHRSEHRPMLYSASPEVQRAYALVEGTYQDVGALPGHPATFRISKVHHILSMEVVNGRIAVLWLYRQLTEEDKDDLLHEPLACYPAPFPRDSLLLADPAQHASQADRMAATVRAWWQVWASGPTSTDPTVSSSSSSSSGSSGNSSDGSRGSRGSSSSSSAPSRTRLRSRDRSAAAGQLLAADFRMWDAYGLWPAMRAQGRRYLHKDAALRYMQSLSYSYNTELTLLDVTVAEGSLACFSHWQMRLVPRWQDHASTSSSMPSLESVEAAEAAQQQQQQQQQQVPASSGRGLAASAAQQQAQVQADGSMLVDGMAVDLFNEDMQLKVIWMFRGPITAQERQLFLEYDKQLAAAEAALLTSEQEAIRASRRAQREQQLSELLTWMNNYQSQWSAYVSHVQKQIARQQRLAKQQLIRQLQESQSLEASLEEEEVQQQSEFGQQMQQQLAQAQQQLLNLQQQAQQQLQSLRQQRRAEDASSGSSSSSGGDVNGSSTDKQ